MRHGGWQQRGCGGWQWGVGMPRRALQRQLQWGGQARAAAAVLAWLQWRQRQRRVWAGGVAGAQGLLLLLLPLLQT